MGLPETLDSVANNFDISSSNMKTMDGIFLLVIAICGNFTGETLGCKLQKVATESVYVKQLIILLMVYFTINFTSSTPAHPWEAIKKTIIIWLGFIMFAKQSLPTTALISALLVAAYFLDNNIKYYRTETVKEKAKGGDINAGILDTFKMTEERLVNAQKFVFMGASASLVIGFLMYLKNKHDEYGDNFDYMKFIFGVPTCNFAK